VILQAAIDAVTDAANVSPFVVPGGVRAVRSNAVLDELRRVEGLGAKAAERVAREAVIHVGGHVTARTRRGGLAAGRMRVHHDEVWWVPRSVIRR